MAHDDPFTLDLFGNTALSSGLGLGVTAFAVGHSSDDNPDDEKDEVDSYDSEINEIIPEDDLVDEDVDLAEDDDDDDYSDDENLED